MGYLWNNQNEMTGVQKGIDFVTHFNNKPFTMLDIEERYNVTRRQAYRILRQAELFIILKPNGSIPCDEGGSRFLWKFRFDPLRRTT
jgi:hypothetical protein